MPEPMNCAHEPQDVACSTASQAWNIAESREPPVPRPPLLMHPASARRSVVVNILYTILM